jgi:hypothetical protein
LASACPSLLDHHRQLKIFHSYSVDGHFLVDGVKYAMVQSFLFSKRNLDVDTHDAFFLFLPRCFAVDITYMTEGRLA